MKSCNRKREVFWMSNQELQGWSEGRKGGDQGMLEQYRALEVWMRL